MDEFDTSAENLGNQTLGRGSLYFDNRYIGNTPTFSIEKTREGFKVHFVCDDISKDNLFLWFKGDTGGLRYEPRNPVGSNIAYDFPSIELTGNGHHNIKSDEWQTLPFTGAVLPVDGVICRVTVPQTYDIKVAE